MILLQQVLNALQLGSIYALIALGYSLVYGVLLLINFAHGDIFMVGAFVAYFAATLLGLSLGPTLLVAMGATALLGVVVERVAYRPLRAAPRVSAVITALGVGLFLENLTLALLGPERRSFPALLPVAPVTIGGVTLSSLQLTIVGVATALLLALDTVVRRSRLGMAMRAISYDREVVPLLGVPVNAVIAATFALGSALAAAAGVLVGLAYPVIEPYMGFLIGWKAFIAAVVGGIGEMRGAVAGAYLLAAIEIFAAATLPSTYRDLIAFVLLALVLIVRPTGLFGWAPRQRV